MAHLPPMRLKRSAVRVVVLVVALVAWVGPVPALAAHPVPGGRYLLSAPDPDSSDGPSHMGVLQVSRSGRALTSEGIPWSPGFTTTSVPTSRTWLAARVRPMRTWVRRTKRMPISASGHPRIVRSGSTATVASTYRRRATSGGDATITLSGQFVSHAKAVLSIVAGTYQVDADSPVCAIPPRTFHFRLRPMPPFGSLRDGRRAGRCSRAPGAASTRRGGSMRCGVTAGPTPACSVAGRSRSERRREAWPPSMEPSRNSGSPAPTSPTSTT